MGSEIVLGRCAFKPETLSYSVSAAPNRPGHRCDVCGPRSRVSFLSPSNQPARMSARHLWPARRRRQAKSASCARTWPFSHQFVSGQQRREARSALPTTTTTTTTTANPTRAAVEGTTCWTGYMREKKSIICQSALRVTHRAQFDHLRVIFHSDGHRIK